MSYPYLRGDGQPVVDPLFQEETGGAKPTSPLQFRFDRVDSLTACLLNRFWHSRLPNFPYRQAKHNRCFSATFDGAFYACAIWTPPVARGLNGLGWYELRRFAIGPDAPRNTASRMLAFMRRDLRKSDPWIERFVSYQDLDAHAGAIYRADGWTCVERPDESAVGWRSRGLRSERGITRKVRWEHQ